MEGSKSTIKTKLIDWIMKSIVVVSSILMVLLTAVVFFNVIARFFFDLPIAFTYELVELVFPWIVCLTLINVTFDNENIDIQFFVGLTPKPMQVVAAYLTKAIMLFFSVYLTISSYNMSQAVKNHTMPLLKLSKSWLYMSAAVSFTGVSIVIIYQTILMIRGKDQSSHEESLS